MFYCTKVYSFIEKGLNESNSRNTILLLFCDSSPCLMDLTESNCDAIIDDSQPIKQKNLKLSEDFQTENAFRKDENYQESFRKKRRSKSKNYTNKRQIAYDTKKKNQFQQLRKVMKEITQQERWDYLSKHKLLEQTI